MLLPHIERILDAARIAPSRDNRQPWRFIVEGSAVSFAIDPERDPTPMNAGDRMARIAVGTAIESVLLRAARMGAPAKFLPARAGSLATLHFGEAKRFADPDKGVVRRVTNRRAYDARALDDETFRELRDATQQPVETAKTHWFGRERVRVIGPIVEEAEAAFLSHAKAREAAFEAMRFDVRDREEVPHGISLGTLELSAPERVAFDALRRAGSDAAAAAGLVTKMAARARRLVESASGVCVISVRGSEPMVDVNAGRAMQRAWIALARRGMVAHPMSTASVLEAMLAATDGVAFEQAERDRAWAAVDALRGAFPSIEKEARIAIWLRVGWAEAPSVRAGRRELYESVQEREPTPSLPPPPTSMPPPA